MVINKNIQIKIIFYLFIATKVSIERQKSLNAEEKTKLRALYKQMLGPAIDIYRKDATERGTKQKTRNEKRKKKFVFF